MERSFSIEKLNIWDVLKTVFKLYIDNLKVFISLSLILFMIRFCSSSISYLKNFMNSSISLFVFSILDLVVLIASFYFGTKVSIALYICISKRYNGMKISMKEALQAAENIFWRYIGVDIQVGLILCIPGILGLLVFLYTEQALYKWGLTSLLAIPVIYLGILYVFAPIGVVIEKEKQRYLSISKMIVKGDFWRIFFILSIFFVVFTGPYILYMYVMNDYRQLSALNRYIFGLLNQALSIFSTPLTFTLYIVLYYSLKSNKRI